MEFIIAHSTAVLGALQDNSRWISARQSTTAADDSNDNNWAKFIAAGS